MNIDRFTILLEGWKKQRLSPPELDEFFAYLKNNDYETAIASALDNDMADPGIAGLSTPEQITAAYAAFDNLAQQSDDSKPQTGRVRVLRRRWLRYAVAIILIFGIGAYLYTNQKSKTVPGEKITRQDISAPQINRATLTLANGKKVFLDSAGNGLIAIEGQTNIQKNTNGELVYDKSASSGKMQYNELSVPRGSQVASVVLSDGSKVFLNAASSLRYPVAFNNKERKVEVIGEAYFEIAKDAQRKFIVAGPGIQTEVLGTHFNVNAYPDEDNRKITLVEGSIRVLSNTSNVVLKPGQQAELVGNNQLKTHDDVNVSQVIAWQKGVFVFSNMNLQSMLRQVSRWYNVEIVYKGQVQSRNFGGTLSRRSPLSDVVKILEQNGVPCIIEKNKLIIGK